MTEATTATLARESHRLTMATLDNEISRLETLQEKAHYQQDVNAMKQITLSIAALKRNRRLLNETYTY